MYPEPCSHVYHVTSIYTCLENAYCWHVFSGNYTFPQEYETPSVSSPDHKSMIFAPVPVNKYTLAQFKITEHSEGEKCSFFSGSRSIKTFVY